MKSIAKSIFASALLTTTVAAQAEVHWHDESISVLHGSGFEVDADTQTTLTLETAGGTSWGDWFGFVDVTDYDSSIQTDTGFYGELSPRISFAKAFGYDMSNSALTDVSLAFTYETGRGDVESILGGIGMDWKLPYMTYFQTNIYRRHGLNNDSDGFQFTPVWRMDFPVGGSNIVFDGFIDWTFQTSHDHHSTNIHINPQIKYDLGMALNGKAAKDTLMVGVEVSYWKNKYGIEDSPYFNTNQNAVSAIIKYHF